MSEMPAEVTPRPLDLLAEALAKFQAEAPTVPKKHTATVKSDKGSYSYTYAGLADVSEAALPLLAKHGLAFITLPGPGVLTGMLLHSSGQSLTASLPIGGSTPQTVGSSLTYMRRYLLGCMTGVVTDDDDDGQLAQTSTTRKAPARKAASTSTASGKGGITSAQMGKLGAQMKAANITTREGALLYVADVIGHPVESRNDLSREEASRVIDALERDLHPPETAGSGVAADASSSSEQAPDPVDEADPWASGERS